MRHPVDITAVLAYIAGGGLAAVFTFVGTLYPGHQEQINASAIALVAFAGVIRVAFNHTPATGTQNVLTTVTPPSKPTPESLTTNDRNDAVNKLENEIVK